MNIIAIYELFPTENSCIEHLEKVRWNGQPTCVYCGVIHPTGNKVKQQKGRNVQYYQCNSCHHPFHVKIGTIFHNTKLPLQKWFIALSLILNAKKGISSCQLARDCGLTQPTAFLLLRKVRKVLSTEQASLLEGIVEMDETYIGGKPRKENKRVSEYKKDTYNKRGRGTNKTAVVGAIKRGGKVIAEHVKKVDGNTLKEKVVKFINTGKSTLYTDDNLGYRKMNQILDHKIIPHKACFAIGDLHTNNIENFWSIVKRGITGIYQRVSDKYLDSYLCEFAYKFNNRKMDNNMLFMNTLHNML